MSLKDFVRTTMSAHECQTWRACFYRKAIRINARMPLASLLVKELQNFQANPTASGNIQFSARSGQHDDIVLSLALLIWEAERDAMRYGVTVTALPF